MSGEIQTTNNNKILIIIIITIVVIVGLIGLCAVCFVLYGVTTTVNKTIKEETISSSSMPSKPCTAKNTETSKSTNMTFAGFVDPKDSNHCVLLDQDGKTIIYGGTVGTK